MKSFTKTNSLLLILTIVFLIFSSCKRNCPPELSTDPVTEITATSAVSGGNVTDDNGSEVIAKGVCYNTFEDPDITHSKTTNGAGLGPFTSNLSQLTPGTQYYVRAYATNEHGTGYGNQQVFTTGSVLPAGLTTASVTTITTNGAVSGGTITSSGGGSITAKGVCWSISENPSTANSKTEDGSGTDTFVSTLTGLCINQKYYLRAYATNSAGTSYGNQVTFTTASDVIFNPDLIYGTITDTDGNTYKTVQIGNQTWMAENLRTTKFNDGSQISLVTDNTAWSALTTAGYSWYDNDACTYKGTYGALYNWYTVNSGKICPSGWHVPSFTEWTTLIDYLGGMSLAGPKLKETGIIHWLNPNAGVTNESGYTALAGGIRRNDGTFNYIRNYSNWWLSTEFSATDAWRWYMDVNSSVYRTNHDKRYGFSIRCLKD